jgi:hypothetical protein
MVSERHNISFEANDVRDNPDASSGGTIQSRWLTVSSLQVLGNLTHKNDEHFLNAIMRQANHSSLIKTLGYPNCTVWIKDNIHIWFGTGGLLAG